MDDLSGKTIKGYQMRELLGQGSFGGVYVAYQELIRREVAVKVILPQYANHPDFIRRFEAEAQLVARLEHPHIVPLYDYWREPNSAFLVMRWLRGGSLRELVLNRPMAAEDAARVLDQIAAALMVAHQNGVVHRDLKPANILLDEQGNAYLADFGIAKDLDNNANNVEATQAGAVVGSPAYLSPEQVKAETVTPRSDIYSLGIVLYEMLTGEKPFLDTGLSALLVKQLNEPLPKLSMRRPDLPESMNKIIQKATAKNPDDRFANALMFAAAFRKALTRTQEVQAAGGEIDIPLSSRTTATLEQLDSDTIVLSGIDLAQTISTASLNVQLPEPENPYKGLRAFQEADASDFFGRDALVEQLMSRLKEDNALSRFLAVVGPSGSGKSSVVKAGVLPKLRAGAMPGSSKWFIVEMVPGGHPFEELEAALLRIAVNPPASLLSQLREDEMGFFRAIKRVLPDDQDTELFLLIDQFEEVFTLVESEETRQAFLRSIVKAVSEPRSRLRLVVTLRADFYDKPLFYGEFGNVMRQRTEVVLPLSPEELELAIARPAERVGLTLEPGLAKEIAEDVGEQPGALPLLQYALTELFERRKDRTLTIDAYRQTGGVSGALARRAEEIYNELDSAEQAALRQLFLRLVTLGEGTEDTRRRVQQSEIASLNVDESAVQHVIDQFGKYRLLTFDRDPSTRENTIEVAHEALIRRWERLREWVNDMREELRLQRRLSASAAEWATSGNDRSFLASGARLTQLEEWARNTDLALTEQESTYLSASLAERERLEEIERQRAQYEEELERRSRQRLRALVTVLAFGLIIALGLAAFALNQQSIAQDERDNAQEQQAIAESNSQQAQSLVLASNARNQLVQNRPNVALALAEQAVGVFEPPLAEIQRVLATTAYAPGIRYRLDADAGPVQGVAFNADRTLAASGHVSGESSVVVLWDLTTGAEIRRLTGHTAQVNAVAFSPDGRLLASASSDMTVILWDVETGEIVHRLEGHGDIVNDVAFSPDGATLASGSGTSSNDNPPADATIRLWDVETGEQVRVLEGHTGAIFDVDYSANGQLIVSSSGSLDRTLRVWDLEAEGNPLIFITPTHPGWIRAAAIAPDNETLVSSVWDFQNSGTLRIWNLNNVNREPCVEGEAELCPFGVGERLLYGHTDVIVGVEYAQTKDGLRLVSASRDRTLRVWDPARVLEIQRFSDHNDRILVMDVSSDGEYVLTGVGDANNPQDTSVRVWDLFNGDEQGRLLGHEDFVWSAAFTTDGTRVISSGGNLNNPGIDNTVRLWDVETGEEIRQFTGHEDTIYRVTVSPDGTQAASASWDGTVRLWDIETGEAVRVFEEHTEHVNAVAFSPDGTRIASGGCHVDAPRAGRTCAEGEMILWDATSGEILHRWDDVPGEIWDITFSPDGSAVFVAAEDTTVRRYDLTTYAETQTYVGHTQGVLSLDISADGVWLLTGGKDTTLRLWDVASGTEVRQFVGHSNRINAVALTGDGQLALSGSADTTLRVWDVATGEELHTFVGHRDWVNGVAFNADGSQAVSASNDRTVRVWVVARNVSDLLTWAESHRYVPELTCTEKEQYQIQDPTCQ